METREGAVLGLEGAVAPGGGAQLLPSYDERQLVGITYPLLPSHLSVPGSAHSLPWPSPWPRVDHFLRQEISGLQLRHLQSASCLPSKMEITIETG